MAPNKGICKAKNDLMLRKLYGTQHHLGGEGGQEAGDDGLQLSVGLVRDLALRGDLLQQRLLVRLDVRQEFLLELGNLARVHLVQVTAHTAVDDGDLLLDGHRHILSLLEQLGQAHTTVQQLLGGGIQIRTELGERSDLTVLGQLQLHRTGDLLHGLGLGSGTDARHGQTDVNGRPDTLVEQLSLQEDLSVCDRDDVGWNVSGHITGLRFDDGQGSERTASERRAHLGRTLQQTRMQIEHITRVGLTTWRTTQQQRHLTVGDGLLGQIVVDDQGVLAVVTEVFTHGTARVRRQVLQRGSIRSGGGHDDGRFWLMMVSMARAVLLQSKQYGCSNDITLERIPCLLPSLTITNDQLTLATTNRHKRIDGLNTGLHGFAHRHTRDDTRSLDTDTEALLRLDFTLTVDGVTEGINDAAQDFITDRHVDDGTGTLDDIAFLDQLVVTEHDHTDVIRLQVKGHTLKKKRTKQ
uniref:Uncharacterized protein n=1 Tax=Anopheles maculatus TaxID=74869 RepID=A0A182SVP3_9DIPT